MDFQLSTEQEEYRDSVIKFSRKYLNENISDSPLDPFPVEKWQQAAKFGLLGLCIPEQWGGAGMDCVSAVNVLDALGYGCMDTGLVHAICTQNLCAIHINAYGTEAQKRKYLPKICQGDLVAAQAISEPGAGSDVAAMRTLAQEDENGFVLNGSKIFTSNGPVADVVIVYAVTAPEKKVMGRTSCLLVERGAPGFEFGKIEAKMGLHSLKNGDLFFSNCRAGKESLLGRAGSGAQMFASGMNWERILLFATFSGKIQRIFERCVEYAKTREQFGSAISTFQSVSNKIVEMRVDLELSRLILMKSAWLVDNGKPVNLLASISKLFTSEACKSACLEAVQLHGGMGYMVEIGLEKELRDSIAGTIYSGTSEIQKNIIAKFCGL